MSERDELVEPCALTVAGALVSVVLLYPDVHEPRDAHRRAHELIDRAFADVLAAVAADERDRNADEQAAGNDRRWFPYTDSEPPAIVT